MDRAKYDNLLRLIDAIAKIKSARPNFMLRVNYTFNNDNVAELRQIWDLFKSMDINVLQIRPMQDIGSTTYTDLDMNAITNDYHELIEPLRDKCAEEGVMFIGPSKSNLTEVDKQQDAYNSMIEEVTYCYISPSACYRHGFDLEKDSFESYH